MPFYDVEIIHYHTVNVEASDEDQAADLALDMESHGESGKWKLAKLNSLRKMSLIAATILTVLRAQLLLIT